MSVLAIIAEYNPLHNGHLYHLINSKKLTNSSYCVCVMSGNFIQRGEPAIIDKWTRAKMAVEAGVDLVLELPVCYSVQTAELFGYGSIKILDSLGIVDNICFGSEIGEIKILEDISQLLVDEPKEFKNALKGNLDKGISFPDARAKAIYDVLGNDTLEILSSSNNILGIEYLKSLKRIKSSIKPFTIKRTSNEYNDIELSGQISSATSIRNSLLNSDLELIKHTIPQTTYKILSAELLSGKNLIFLKNFEREILSNIRKMSINELKNIFDVHEGLENRIKKAAMETDNIQELLDLIKSKRYTRTRIQRILIHILLGLNKDVYSQFAQSDGPQYIRVLAFNENGRNLLNEAKKKCELPLISKLKNLKYYENKVLVKMLEYDITATNLYNLAYNNSEFSKGNTDFTTDVIYVK